MVYNEPVMLPWWLRHYARQVGERQCYVIDHDSDDGSTASVGRANLIRIPRGQPDEALRADFVSDFCTALLRWHDWVLYADVDEMLVADPARYATLSEYCAGKRPDVVTAFGVNLLHRFHEPHLDPTRPLLAQRQWVFPVSSMAKPLLIRVPTRWAAGFHSADKPVVFDGLTNFHLAYADFHTTVTRQVKRRRNKAGVEGHHHLMSDEALFQMMKNWSNMVAVDDVALNADCQHMSAFIHRIIESSAGREGRSYKIDMGLWENRLWKVPERFHEAF